MENVKHIQAAVKIPLHACRGEFVQRRMSTVIHRSLDGCRQLSKRKRSARIIHFPRQRRWEVMFALRMLVARTPFLREQLSIVIYLH